MTLRRFLLALVIAIGIAVVSIVAIVVIAVLSGPSDSRVQRATSDVPAIQTEIASAEQVSPKQAVNTNSPGAWRTVASWSGSGMKETESFNVESREWRISWETSNEPFAGAGLLQIYVYNDQGEMVSLAANRQGLGRDVSYVRGKGRFHLMLNSANIDWSVMVEDQP
jgi:hypothetical protein